jgi:competence protein ComEC
VPAAGAAWASAGFGTQLTATAALWIASGMLALVLTLLVLRGRRRRHPGRTPPQPWHPALLSAGAVSVLVLLSVAAQLSLRSAGLLPDLIERRASVVAEVTIRSDPREVRREPDRPARDQGPRFTLLARVDHVTGRGHSGPARAGVLVIGDERWSGLRPGEHVRAHGRLVPAEPGDDVTALLMPSGPPMLLAGAGPVQRHAEQLRAGLRDASAGLAADSAGLLPGLVVGDTSRLPPDLEEAMRVTGLTHLTAVSGSNVAIVCGTVLLVAGACGAGRRLRVVLAFAGLLGFVVLARPDPSVLRAAVMGAVGLLGLVHARRGQGMPALCTAVIALTIADPWLGRAFGFALSVLATSGLLLLARPWAVALHRVVPLPVAHAVAVPAAAQAVCAPVVVLLAPQLSLSAVPANLLVAPAVAPATVLGVVATVLAPLWPGAAAVVAWWAGWCTWWIATVARTAAALPASTVPWPGGGRGALLLAVATLLAVLLAPAVIGGLARLVAAARSGRNAGRTGRRLAAVLAVVSVLGALLLWPQSPLAQRLSGGWPPAGWRMVACDVGQGDALVVATGARSAALFDAGPEPGAVDGCLGRLGIETLDLVVVTHFHADHAGGITGALRGRAVDRLLVSPLPKPAASARAVDEAAREAGVTVEVATAGLHGDSRGLRWQVLSPAQPDAGRAEGGAGGPSESVSGADPESSEVNDASLVLLVEVAGLRALITGDIEPGAQAALRRTLAEAPDLLPVDVLKVAHHGSARQDAGLHELIAPRVALVSAGERNDYGHPAPATLDLLERVGSMVLRTDQLGDVAIGGDGASMWAAGRSGQPDSAAEPAASAACLAEPQAGPVVCRPDVALFARGKSSIVASIGTFDLAQRRTGTRRAGHGRGESAGRPRDPARPRRPARPVAGARGRRHRRCRLRGGSVGAAHEPFPVRRAPPRQGLRRGGVHRCVRQRRARLPRRRSGRRHAGSASHRRSEGQEAPRRRSQEQAVGRRGLRAVEEGQRQDRLPAR